MNPFRVSAELVVGLGRELGREFGPELELKGSDSDANADATGPRLGIRCQTLEAPTGH